MPATMCCSYKGALPAATFSIMLAPPGNVLNSDIKPWGCWFLCFSPLMVQLAVGRLAALQTEGGDDGGSVEENAEQSVRTEVPKTWNVGMFLQLLG